MNWQNVATIARKDITIMMTRRSLRIALVVLPLGLAVLFSQIIARANMPAATLPKKLNAFLFFFMIYTGALPANLASYSMVGEKVERSLEPLLATPASDGEILLGKGLAALVPPLRGDVGGHDHADGPLRRVHPRHPRVPVLPELAGGRHRVRPRAAPGDHGRRVQRADVRAGERGAHRAAARRAHRDPRRRSSTSGSSPARSPSTWPRSPSCAASSPPSTPAWPSRPAPRSTARRSSPGGPDPDSGFVPRLASQPLGVSTAPRSAPRPRPRRTRPRPARARPAPSRPPGRDRAAAG